MKKFNIFNLALIAVLLTISTAAYASKMTLTRKDVNELTTLAASSIDTAADYIIVWDNSALDVRKVVAPALITTTATGAELNTLAGVTAGTVAASKAVVVDANKDISSFRNIGYSGTLTNTRAPSADSATTNKGIAVNLTAPVDTTGTNTHNAIDVALTISNSTGGTNAVNAVNIGNVTGDAQDNVTGVKIGTGTTLGTSNAIQVGSGWDAGLVLDSPLQVGSTDGTAISAIRFAFDAVANGQTSKTTTLTGATASSRCVASAAETATNAVYIRSVVPGTNQVVITTSGDPGASNMDFTVVCYN